MTNDEKLMQQALDALVYGLGISQDGKRIDPASIYKQPEPEPVAWQVHPFDYGIGHEGVYARTDRPEQVEMWKRKGWTVQPLYAAPPQREFVGLTDEEITALKRNGERYISSQDFARAIEAKLKEKNAKES